MKTMVIQILAEKTDRKYREFICTHCQSKCYSQANQMDFSNWI